MEQLPGERGAARLLAVGGVAAALGLVAHEPGVLTAAHGVGLLLSLGLAVLALRRGLAAMVPMHVAMLIVATAVAGLGGACWGGAAALWVGVLLQQSAAGLLAPSLPAALTGAALIGGAAAVGAAWSGSSLAVWAGPLAGIAVAGAQARLLDALARAQPRAATSPRIGQTRAQLVRAERELAVMTSQLRRESKQRREAEAQALSALKTRAAFLAAMSHELRTPLHQIIGYSELLLEEIADEAPTAAEDVRRIHLASLNLLEMIANVLDLAKIEAGTMVVATEPFAVGELIENLAQEFAGQARQRGNVIRVRCPAELPPLHSDRTKLRTVLASLLSNACKFTRDGTIRVAVASVQLAGAAALEVEVSDTGIGMPPGDTVRLFAAFVQADGSSTRRHDGSGLGLAIAHHFCTMLGGEITVESRPGVGSTFRVRVPREFVDPRLAGHILSSTIASLPQSPAA